MIRHEDIDDGPLSSKVHKVCCCSSACLPCNFLFHSCRKSVSRSKVRYIKDGFDLDLTYVVPRVIVHGFPAAGLEHIYRNPRLEIKRFLDSRHYDHYKLFNFCCEPGRGYDPEIFHGRVERYPFKDHNTPPLETMVAFANSAKLWLDTDPANVVSMHCKAGKGRAGLMCCVTLIRAGYAQSATEALEIYDRERVTNNRGLTVTSQRKFVIFYEALWRHAWNIKGNIGDIAADSPECLALKVPEQPQILFYGIELLNIKTGISITNIQVKVYRVTNFLPENLIDTGFLPLSNNDTIGTDFDCTVKGNFKIEVYSKMGTFGSKVRLFEFLHNTYFMQNSTPAYTDFAVDQLDIKRKMKAKLGNNIILRLKMVPTDRSKSAEQLESGKKGYGLIQMKENSSL
eukprot:gene4132-5886_t